MASGHPKPPPHPVKLQPEFITNQENPEKTYEDHEPQEFFKNPKGSGEEP